MLLHPAIACEPDHDLAPIRVHADPNGLAYAPHEQALYIADGTSGAVLRVDGDRQRRLATIDAGGVIGTQRIAGLTVAPDGTVFVSRPGYGQAGAIFRIAVDGEVSQIPGLPPQVWRLGVTYDAADHALYTTQFLTSPRGAHDGAIVAIDLVTAQPSMILDGFGKPIGIVKLGSTLVVADARQHAVFRVELVRGRAVSRLQLACDLDRPDSLCACGPDSVLVTTYDEHTERGAVRRVWLDGRSRVVASGAWEPRGVATDGKRVFVSSRRGGQVLVVEL